MNTDGVSYLDVGDAYLRGDWKSAVNAYWSPLYCWLLGLGNWIAQPSSYWEFPLAHLVNFLIYVAALFAFDFFLRELINHQRTHRHRRTPPEDMDGGLPRWAWMLLGYTLFAWSSLDLIGLRLITPDMLVAVTVYAAAGILLRIASRGRKATRLAFMGLGAWLGLGYLAKAAMFPLAPVFLLVSGFSTGHVRDAAPRLSLALLTFLLVASPFLIALSVSKGRPTFGDSGKLAYAWYVNATSLRPDEAVVFSRHWHGEPAGSGTPQHSTRQVGEHPPIYEFGTPVQGTYPLWYDPSYWHEGLRVHFDAREQLRVIASSARWYYDVFVGLPLLTIFRHGLSAQILSLLTGVPLLLIFGWVLLAHHSQRKWLALADVSRYWFLAAPGVAAMLMYSLVYVEARYIAASAVLVYASIFAALRLPDSKGARVLCAATLVPLSASFLLSFNLSSAPRSAPLYYQVADAWRRMGMQPGAKIASLQHASRLQSKWARLARARIVAEIYPHVADVYNAGDSVFWMAPDSVRRRILETFARVGADIVVSADVPAGAPLHGWQPIGETGYFAYFLK